jgi:GAF domain-containing protein
LAIRSDRLQTAAEIARDVTIETDLDIMLQRAATLIADRLELYFAGIYLLDRSGDFSQLVAGSGDEGQLLVDSDHRASMGVATPLSYTMTTGEPRLIREDDATLNLIRHPVLPNLREQLVLPLKAGNDLIGAIDLQSETLHKFSEDDIPALSVLADQLAIAIQKNQLTSNMEQTLNELETAYGRYTRESWESFLAEKNITGYRFSQLSVEPTTSTDPEVREAWMTGEIVVLNDGQSGRMLVPMKVRGQVIGVLNLGYQGENLTQETRALVDEIATRLGLIMENARLVETAQRRVERERLVGEVTTRMRQTLDMDGVLRTSVEEIARTLGLPEMEIRLGNYMSKLGSNGNGHLKANSNSLAADANNGNTANGYDPLLDDDVDDSPPGNPQG